MPYAKATTGKPKKQRESTQSRRDDDSSHTHGLTGAGSLGRPPLRFVTIRDITAVSLIPDLTLTPSAAVVEDRYPWKRGIVTTTFWIGEDAARNNPVPNYASSWDQRWAKSYGGTDTPVKAERVDYRPAAFEPGQNPFYIALPYNDIQASGHKPEAEKMIPWFKSEFKGKGKTVCKGRWLAIRFKNRTTYAQWEDCGPFRTDHASYVFGDERPKPNLNKGAGLDVSPAVRDYLGMNDTDVTDWKFVDFDEVPQGPWSKYGDNNTFVINKRLDEARVAALEMINSTLD
jgi:hypothetical protein